MFLSRVQLRPSHFDPGMIHRCVNYAFPDPLPDDERVLWRREEDYLLLVQSTYPPVWRAARDVVDSQMKEILLEELLETTTYFFRLRANTTKCKYQSNDQRGQIVGLYTATEQQEWLMSRAGDMGVEILSSQVTLSKREVFNYRGNTITLAVAQFDGVLQVRDDETFRCIIADGVGPAKAFGCGLLSVVQYCP